MSLVKKALFVGLLVLPATGYAGGVGGLGSYNELATTTVRFLQGAGLIYALYGFVKAGKAFIDADREAKDKLYSAFVGAALIGGAALIVEFIKSFFSL